MLSVFLLLPVLHSVAQKRTKVLPISEDTFALEQINPLPLRSVIKTNIFPMIWGVIPLTAEYRLNVEFVTGRHQSAEFSIAYLGKSPIFSLIELLDTNFQYAGQRIRTKVRGFRLQALQKFYLGALMKNSGMDAPFFAPKGPWVGIHASYSIASFKTPLFNTYQPYETYRSITHYNFNILGGMQLKLGKRFVFDFFSGIGYKRNIWVDYISPNFIRKAPDQKEMWPFYNSRLKLTLGLNFGIGFGHKYRIRKR